MTERGSVRAYSFEGVGSLDMPTITIVYEIAQNEIIVHDARFTEPRHRDAGRS